MLINSYVAVHGCIFRQLQRYLQPVSNFQIISNSSRRMDKVAGDKMTRVASIVIIHLFIFFFCQRKFHKEMLDFQRKTNMTIE